VATGVKVALIDPAGRRHLLEINRPYKTGHTSVLFNDLGVAPLFVIKDSTGRELDGAYVKLNVLKGKQDQFVMQGYRIAMVFDPENSLGSNAGLAAIDKVRSAPFQLAVSNSAGVPVASGVLSPGQSLTFNGYTLAFREQSFWVRLLVVKEYGLELVYAGFACATLALIWRLFFYRRELLGGVQEDDGKILLHLAWKSEFYQRTAAEEFNRLVAALAPGHDSGRFTSGTVAEGASRKQ
jgi:hypothetical protein